MSYESYISSNLEIELGEKHPNISRNARDGLMPDNTEIWISLDEEQKTRYKYNYLLGLEELHVFKKDKKMQVERFIDQMRLILESVNQKGNRILLENKWVGKPTQNKYLTYKQEVNYDKLSDEMLSLFFELLDFDINQLSIIF